MKKLPLQGRTLALLAVIIPLLVLFIYVGLRSGPLAPVAVTVASVESRAITPRCSASVRWRRATLTRSGRRLPGASNAWRCM